jgi:hypothetical protein
LKFETTDVKPGDKVKVTGSDIYGDYIANDIGIISDMDIFSDQVRVQFEYADRPPRNFWFDMNKIAEIIESDVVLSLEDYINSKRLADKDVNMNFYYVLELKGNSIKLTHQELRALKTLLSVGALGDS